MATVRARFVLEDGATGTMRKIVREAGLLESALEKVEGKLGDTDGAYQKFTDNWNTRSVMMRKAFHDDAGAMRSELTDLHNRLKNMSSRKVMRLDLDTGQAMQKLRAVENMMERALPRRAVGSRASGMGIAGVLDRRAQEGSILSKMFLGAAKGADVFGSAIDKVGVNIGPFSTKLGSLIPMLAAIGPAVTAPIAAGISVLSTSLVALTAGAVGAVGILGAFGVGLAAIAIPAISAAKGLKEKNKEIDKNKKALDAAEKALARTNKTTKVSATSSASYSKSLSFMQRAQAAGVTNTDKYRAAVARVSDYENKASGTSAAYTRAVQRRDDALKAYNKSLGKVSKSERELNRNVATLKKSWQEQVMEGPSGQRALGMMASGVGFANQQMPFVAGMMDQYTAKAEKLFDMAERKAPMFRRNMTRATADWPDRFYESGQSIGHLTDGFLGVLEAGKPLTEWMSKSLLADLERFDRWAQSAGGQKDMIVFFDKMKPVLSELKGLGGDTLSSMFSLAGRDGDDAVYFIGQLREIIRALPEEIDFWTDKMKGAWPIVEEVGTDIYETFKSVADVLSDIKDVFEWIGEKMPNIKLPDMPEGMEDYMRVAGLAGLGVLTTKGGRGLVGKMLGKTKMGGKDVAARMVPGAGAVLGAADAGKAAIPVFVTNWAMMGMGGVGGVPGIPGKPGTKPGRKPPRIPPWLRGVGGRLLVGAGLVDQMARDDSFTNKHITPRVERHVTHPMASRMQRQADAANEAARARARQRQIDRMSTSGGKTAGVMGPMSMNTPLDFRKQADYSQAAKAREQAARDAAAVSRAPGDPRAFQQRYSGMSEAGQNYANSMMGTNSMSGVSLGKFIKTKGAQETLRAIDVATRTAMRKGEANMRIGGMNMVITYNKELDKIETRRIDLSGFFTDMWAKFTSGVRGLSGIVQSVTGPLDSFWSALTGDSAAGSSSLPQANGLPTGTQGPPAPKKAKGKKAGDGKGVVGSIMSGVSNVWDMAKNAVSTATNWLADKGSAGSKTASGINGMYEAFEQSFAQPWATGGGGGGSASANGLTPAAQQMLAYVSRMFGVNLTSGFRPGAVTEFGNASLHGMGQAIDVGGSAAQMQAVWQALQGKAGIKELIYNGMASYNGGMPVPFTGSDKHTDHVHIGMGDGVGVPPSTPAGSPAGGRTQALAGITVQVGDVHITDGSSYEEFERRLAAAIERAIASLGIESAEEMIA